MRFPFQRSPGADLRELFKYERLRAGAEPLGQSSIDEGSGSLDVRDGEGGTAASIGDLPGGGVGIGIRWNGNLTDLAEILQDLADEIASGGGGGNNDLWDNRQDRDIAGLRVRAGHIENTNTLQGQSLGRLGKRADTKDREIFGLDRRVKGLEDRAAALGVGVAKVGRDTEQATRGLASANGRITKNSGDILEQNKRGDILEVMLEEAQQNRSEDRGLIDSLIEWFDGLLGDTEQALTLSWRQQNEIKAARGGRGTLGVRISTVETATSAAQSTANGAASAASSAQSAASAAQTAASNAQASANAAQSSADQANDRITDARGSFGSLTQRLNAGDTATAAAQSAANTANDRITDARGSFGSLTQRLDNMTSATSSAASAASSAQSTANNAQATANDLANNVVPGLVSAIPVLVSAINNLRSRVAALDGGPGGPINP